jgi:hypothetical protein
VGFILLHQGEEEIERKLGGTGRGLVPVLFAFPNLVFFLKKSGKPINRNKFPAIQQSLTPYLRLIFEDCQPQNEGGQEEPVNGEGVERVTAQVPQEEVNGQVAEDQSGQKA